MYVIQAELYKQTSLFLWLAYRRACSNWRTSSRQKNDIRILCLKFR